MAALLVRNLDEEVKARLKARAKRNGRSLEAEARNVLTEAASKEAESNVGLGTQLANLFAEFGITELELPPRQISEPINFDE